MSESLYEKMVKIAEAANVETAHTDKPLFSHYKNDLYVIDKDMIENDSQSGDHYIWAIKDNGCGTYLNMTGFEQSKITIGTVPPDSRFYHITVYNEGRGEIEQINKEKALALIDIHKVNPHRVPRRTSLVEHLDRLAFPGGDEGYSVSKSRILSEFNPRPGDKTALMIAARKGADNVVIQVLRTKMKPNDQDDSRVQKKIEEYYFPKTLTASTLYSEKPRFVVLETTQQGFAKIEEITEKMYKKEVLKMARAKEREREKAEELGV